MTRIKSDFGMTVFRRPFVSRIYTTCHSLNVSTIIVIPSSFALEIRASTLFTSKFISIPAAPIPLRLVPVVMTNVFGAFSSRRHLGKLFGSQEIFLNTGDLASSTHESEHQSTRTLPHSGHNHRGLNNRHLSLARE